MQDSDNYKPIEALALKSKLKSLSQDEDRNDMIRLHRAISWVKCAEENSDNPDLKFISLWIAFNASYSDIGQNQSMLSEKQCFREFIEKLVVHDKNEQFFAILWNKFPGPVRLLIDNKFAYKLFWDAHNNDKIDWETRFKQSKIDSRNYLAHQHVSELLGLVLDRLYTVRNQLIHGNATYKSKVNRSQVQDGCHILGFLVPIIIDIMMSNISEDWGTINYPVINN